MLDILIADDEKVICDSVKSKILRIECEHIHTVHTAYGGQEAMDSALRFRPHIVITDIKMPSISGIEVIRCLSKKMPQTRFIVLSGYDEYKYIRQAFLLGVYDYLLKPISMVELKKALTCVMDSIAKDQDTSIDERLKAMEKPTECTSIIDVAVSYMRENYQMNITLAEIANMVSMNYSYLSQLFKEHLGKSYSRVLTEIRMEKAAVLLHDPVYRVSDVAYMVGYGNPYHFSKSFKNFYGVSPKAYRTSEHRDTTNP